MCLALVALAAACGPSSGDSTQVVSGEAAVAPGPSPTPTVPASTSEEIARKELDNLIQLAQGELTLDKQELAAYSEEVGAALNRIDSDGDVLEAFKNLLEDALGVTFVFGDVAGLNDIRLGKVGRASPLFAPVNSSSGPFKCSAGDPDFDSYAQSKAWLYLTCFMDALFDATVPASEALNAANPLFATEIPKLFVRSQVTNNCINDIDRCVRGDDPVLTKFQQGDFAGAHKAIREQAARPPPRLTPTEVPTGAPTRAPTEVPTLVPATTAILPPTIGLEPAPIPTAAPGGSGFSGTWVGRYTGLYTHGFPICGTTIPIEGPITAVLTQIGMQVTGTATLGGVDVLEIVQDENGNCSVVIASDEVTMIFATVSGDTLRSASGLPVNFTMTKISENSAEGTTKGPYLDATFFLGRLR